MADRGRAAAYERPLVPALYELDLRLTSRLLWGTSVAEQARFARRAIDGASGERLLDVPAGTGLLVQRALRGAEPPSLIVATDLSGNILRRARRRLGPGAVYVEADASRLPFREGAFAAVHSGNGFHVFPDRASAASELARVLAPGGVAAITAWTEQGNPLARAYQRLLARLDHVNRPTAAADHVGTFEAAGLVERSSVLGGTLLRWLGTRA